MAKDLTNSNIDRQNILNNRYAITSIQEYIGFPGMLFEKEYRYTKKMIAEFYEVDVSTIDRYIHDHKSELKHNGYILKRGKALTEFKLTFGHLIDKVTKTTILGLFNFRSFLNLGMLLKERERVVQNTAHDTAHDSDGIIHAANTAHSDILTVLQRIPRVIALDRL